MVLFRRITTLVLAGMLTLFGATLARAADMVPQSDQETIAQELRVLGVPQDQVTSLVQAFARGEVWDSLKPGQTPKATEQYDIDGEHVTVHRFADGSVIVESISLPAEGKAANRAVNGCKVTKRGGTRVFKGCHASVNLVVVSMAFDFDYIKPAGRQSSITAYRNYSHHVVGGSLHNFRFSKMSPQAVRLSADCNLVMRGFPAGWTAWMQVNVSGLKAWTTHN